MTYKCEGISSKETVSIVLTIIIIIKAHLLLKVSPVPSITSHSVFTKPFGRKYQYTLMSTFQKCQMFNLCK
jgi:hypothetical protein